MLKIHQPYIKSRELRQVFAFASIGVLLLGSLIIINSSSEDIVYAAGDTRTIHDIENMQDMTQQICSNTKEGDTAALVDKRENAPETSYTVVKLPDQNCWMQENLRLGGSSEIILTSNDSNVSQDYKLPASRNGSWNSSDTAQQIRIGEPGMTINSSSLGDGEGWQPNYGNYYSWCAATAGTCSEYISDSINVSGSICPLGWHLPTGGSGGEFYDSFSSLNATAIQTDPYKFPAAGSYNGQLGAAGVHGAYWSSTSGFSASYAHLLSFDSNFNAGLSVTRRYIGFSVRCVAMGGLPKIEKPLFTTSEDANINVDVPSILTIDAASGLAETADASKIIEGTATATISSNTEYNVTLHSTQPSLKDPTVTTAEISPVSSSNSVQPGNNSWGFWDGTGSADTKTYTIPITTEPQSLYNTATDTTNTSGDPATLHTYYVGISISPSLPSGTYATDVIITASTK